MMAAIRWWFSSECSTPADDSEIRELTEQRHSLMAQAKVNSAQHTAQALDLIEETTAEKLRMVEAKESRESMAILELLGKMNRRLHE